MCHIAGSHVAAKRLKQSDEDVHKWSYAQEAAKSEQDPFTGTVHVATDIKKVCCVPQPAHSCLTRFSVLQAIEWTSQRTKRQIRKEREEILVSLEWADKMLRESGACEVRRIW